jgi:glycosyltransferase involved in cell wall biosynthesis
MNILLTLHYYLDPNAGAASVTLSLGEAYKRMGHSVSYYSFDNLPKKLPSQILYIIFPFYFAFHVVSLSRKTEINVIHASSVDAWFWGFVLRKLCFGKCPTLATQSHGLEHTMHERILEDAKNGDLKLSWKYPLYNGSALLWTAGCSFKVSDFSFMLNIYDSEIVQNKIGVAPDRIKLFPNGIPNNLVGLPFREQTESRSLGVAFIGTYIPRKGIHYGIPALNTVMLKTLDLRAVILGTRFSVDEVLKDFSPEVHDRVEVIPSFDKSDLPQLLRNCHILLFPSLSEGFPLALPEAMACGLAPISSKIPGPTEIITDTVNGILVESRNQKQIEVALLQLIEDRKYLNQLRTNAYNSVQDYTWDSIARKHLDLYKSSISIDA